MTDDRATETTIRPLTGLGRRQVLLGAGAVGVAGVLAACGNGDNGGDNGGANGGDDPGVADPTDPTAEPEPSATEEADPPAAGGEAIATTGDVPVGEGVIVAAAGVVITQPSEGEFRAFSSTCTHLGCQVSSVSDGLIRCPCHGSRYFIADGSVENGPATSGLPEVGITVDGDQILRA